jgi:hypothetical protein
MKTIPRISAAVIGLCLLISGELWLVVPEAQAIFGVWRRTARRCAIIGTAAYATTAATVAAGETAAAEQQAAVSQQQAAQAQKEAAAQQQTAEAQKQAATLHAAAAKPLPLGTVVQSLPAGCTPTPVGGVEYYYCSGNFYRAVFQGNSLVYVTAQPK